VLLVWAAMPETRDAAAAGNGAPVDDGGKSAAS
jgi:hypothetical protein